VRITDNDVATGGQHTTSVIKIDVQNVFFVGSGVTWLLKITIFLRWGSLIKEQKFKLRFNFQVSCVYYAFTSIRMVPEALFGHSDHTV